MSEQPVGWEKVYLPAISELVMGQSPPSHTYNTSGHGLPFFQGKAEFGQIHPVPVKYCSMPIKIAETDDILISVRAPVGPTNVCRERSCIGRGLAAIRAKNRVTSRYLFYFLRSIEQWLGTQGTGSTFTAISKADLERIQVPLPPLGEQLRIVAKLEELLAKVEACQKRLAKIPVILKRFRQGVRAAACSGDLTVDWREKNVTPTSFTEILKDVAAEAMSRRQWPEDEIPSDWVWIRFGDLIAELRNGISIRPNQEPPGVPILRISAARPGKVDLSDIRFLPEGERFLPEYQLQERDLLFTRYNGSLELLGVCGMVRGLRDEALL